MAHETTTLPDRYDVVRSRLRIAAKEITGPHGELFMRAYDAIGEIKAERNRLRDILDCERGIRAPEGWTRVNKFDCDWENQRTGMRVDNVSPGRWQAYRWTGQQDLHVDDEKPSALEAIEAADRAAKENA